VTKTKVRAIAKMAVYTTVILCGLPVMAYAYERMPEAIQISSAIVVAGGLIAAAIWFRKAPVIILGSDAIEGAQLSVTNGSVNIIAPDARSVTTTTHAQPKGAS
jgi:hypothetical protein